MCVYSMIMDHYSDEWHRRMNDWRRQQPYIAPYQPADPFIQPASPWQPNASPGIGQPISPSPIITPQEIEEFKRLLERAREYDKRNNEPDCELESKKEKLRELAKEMGIEIEIK